MEFQIRLFKSKDIPAIHALSDKVFGKDYIKSKAPLSHCPVVLVAEFKQETLGFACARIEESSTEDKITAVLDLIAVDPKYQSNGIGKALFKARMEELVQLGFTDYKVFHWYRESMTKPFLAIQYGFQFYERKENFWTAFNAQHNFECKICSPELCACPCDIYTYKRPGL